ncbi:MAG: hypothetical protein HYT46_03760 [Candidatus Vogelbacteria bacterium]|nr:hypothetical protein [Candidatus Vogelbacteria bacterium]
MDENTNKIATSGLNNVLSGVGIFILGILLDFFLLGPGLMSDFGLGETWVKRALIMTMIVIIGYGLVGYVLGKIKPNLSWKSGLVLTFGAIINPIFGLLWLIRDFSSSQNIIPGNLLLILPFIAVFIVAPVSSYLGSRSKKTWQGKFPAKVLEIVLIIVALFVTYKIVGILVSLSRGPTTEAPTLPVSNNKTLSP